MKKSVSVWLVVISLLITAMACNLASASNPEEASQDGDNIVRVTGTVIHLPFEGGFWGIVGDDGEKYLPLALPQELQCEGLRAEFELEILEDVGNIYLWGIAVNVLDYGEAFEVAYILTVFYTLGGSVTTPAEWISPCAPSTVIDLVAKPWIGYRFVNWSGDVDTIANISAAETTITMDGSYSITANFEEIPTYDLTISSTDGGSVTSTGEGVFTYDEGAVVDLVATPDKGYQFVNWTGDVAAIDDVNAATITITMDGNYSITANFEEIPPPPINWPLIGGIIAAVVAVGLGIFFVRRKRVA